MHYRRLLLSAIALTAAALMPAQAQDAYPNKPLTLVVPFAPGGSTDATARIIAQELGKLLGQQVIVDNRAGAAGNIGTSFVARSEPDGYTLLMATSGLLANASLYKSLNYDFARDLDGVSRVALIPNVLVVAQNHPANSLNEFIASAKNAKTPLTYGSAGAGSGQHLAGALFASKIGAQMTHVPYKGGAPAITDLVGGRIDAIFAPQVEVLPYIRGNTLKALAVTTKSRSFALPDAPAIEELFPGFEIALWNGIMVRHGTPEARVAKLNSAVQTALALPHVQAALRKQGSIPAPTSVAELKTLVSAELVKWANIVRISGAEAQ